eukprot:ANDGO_01483.mRNA.1 hypothetical protein
MHPSQEQRATPRKWLGAEYTSKTCGRCGEIHARRGAEAAKCLHVPRVAHRLIEIGNGAWGIYLKHAVRRVGAYPLRGNGMQD